MGCRGAIAFVDVRSAIAVWDVEEVRSLLGCEGVIAFGMWGGDRFLGMWRIEN
ncbi:hypothetical protein H6F47_00205 [Sphaerospermopsis sp. FACHB-1094]|uniref:hypothetical protein n=1 Tax=Sphaerospermopsis sp. FACHB-1094 TaxID=2692861 RepID=UPI00168A00D2|nr:hypothetical protein [Sphaerospermopsis sp. FACHB-1094]MBD2130932.1 hypothetical protein [Sphaerospermopsis sp. FACHB-1094]